jgi:predicted aldo/keto reductase-like oxidoreductase
MFAINFADRFTYNLEGLAVPLAAERNVGVVAMKVYGGASGMDYKTPRPSAMGDSYDHQLALRYALSIEGVATAVIGMYNEAELDQNIAWARSFTPLMPAESAWLETLGRELSAQWGAHYGSVDDRQSS